jgi:hypothetical protein
MVEILKDNGRPEAGAVYAALDMPWAERGPPEYGSRRIAQEAS